MKKFFLVFLMVTLLSCSSIHPSDSTRSNAQLQMELVEFEYQEDLNIPYQSDLLDYHRQVDDRVFFSYQRKTGDHIISLLTDELGYYQLSTREYHTLLQFHDENIRIWDYAYMNDVLLASIYDGEESKIIVQDKNGRKVVFQNHVISEFQVAEFFVDQTNAYFLNYDVIDKDLMKASLMKFDFQTLQFETLYETDAYVKDVPDYRMKQSLHHLTFALKTKIGNVIYDYNTQQSQLEQMVYSKSVGNVIWYDEDHYILMDIRNQKSISIMIDKKGNELFPFKTRIFQIYHTGERLYYFNQSTYLDRSTIAYLNGFTQYTITNSDDYLSSGSVLRFFVYDQKLYIVENVTYKKNVVIHIYHIDNQ